MKSRMQLVPGTPVFTKDDREVGHVAEVRDEALRINVPRWPDFWLPLETVAEADSTRVSLRLADSAVDENRMRSPDRTYERRQPLDEVSTFIATEDGLPLDQRTERDLDMERFHVL